MHLCSAACRNYQNRKYVNALHIQSKSMFDIYLVSLSLSSRLFRYSLHLNMYFCSNLVLLVQITIQYIPRTSRLYNESSQYVGPAAGITRITLAAPGVPNGNPAVTTMRSLSSATRPFFFQISHATESISRKLSVLRSCSATYSG